MTKSKNAVEIPVEKLHRDPNQPREEFGDDALNRLAESMRTRGQLQPIRVRWDEGRGAYVIIAGERRWRAARMAGMATISAVVVEGDLPAAELLALQLVENCLREDLSDIEQAKAFRCCSIKTAGQSASSRQSWRSITRPSRRRSDSWNFPRRFKSWSSAASYRSGRRSRSPRQKRPSSRKRSHAGRSPRG